MRERLIAAGQITEASGLAIDRETADTVTVYAYDSAPGKISVTGGRDDLAFLNNVSIPVGQKWAALIVGTYYVDKDATFVNARLVRATDGLVLRTGQLVLPNTGIVQRMSESDVQVASRAAAANKSRKYGQNGYYPPLYTPGSALSSGSLPIRQGK